MISEISSNGAIVSRMSVFNYLIVTEMNPPDFNKTTKFGEFGEINKRWVLTVQPFEISILPRR